jgi:PAP2 superfamily C-terminal
MVQSYLMTRENRCRVMMTFFRVATISYACRTLTISLTSLPGPAPHCRPGSPLYLPPSSWIDIVTRVGPMYGQFYSCGDLIFSGHMAYTNSALLLYLRTLDRYFMRFSRLRWLTGVLYLALLAVLCIAGRKHYSVDVILGLLISTLVYFHFEHSWIPSCLHPPRHPLQQPQQQQRRRARKSDMDLFADDDDMFKPPRIVVVSNEKPQDEVDPMSSLLLFRSNSKGSSNDNATLATSSLTDVTDGFC